MKTLKHIVLFFAFAFSLAKTNAQTIVKGVVYDSISKNPIAYVDFNFANEQKFYSSDEKGHFKLESLKGQDSIDVFAYGYKPIRIAILKDTINTISISLIAEEEDNTIVSKEVVVATDSLVTKTSVQKRGFDSRSVLKAGSERGYKKKKENPAYRILRGVWDNKKENGLTSVNQYEYDEYEKIEFDLNNIDSTFMKSRIFKDFEFVFERMDTSRFSGKAYLPIFLNESVYKVYGSNNPKKFRKDLLGNKVSGIEQNELVSQGTKNIYKEYDVYNNRINLFNKGFISPLARDGFSFYEYELLDSLKIDGTKYFKIKYYPKNKAELTFKGKILIADKIFAVKEITMQASKDINVNFIKDVFIEQYYKTVNDSLYLPEYSYVLFDLSFLSKNNTSKGIYAHRTVTYKNYDFKTKKKESFYTKRYDPVLNGAYEKDEFFWHENRHEKLTENESGVYETLDKLNKIPRFNRIIETLKILGSGYINVFNAIDIGSIYNTFGYNDIEGLRLRVGARTFFSANDFFRLQGYLAYGTMDDRFKYGAEYRHMFNKYSRLTIGIGNKRDVEQLGGALTTDDGILSRSFASSSIIGTGANVLLSNINKTNAFIKIDPLKNVTLRVDVTQQKISSAAPSLFDISFDLGKGAGIEDVVRDNHLTFSILATPGAKFYRYGIDRIQSGSTLSPTILLKYSQGFEGVLNSNFEYQKISFLYNHPLLIGNIGLSDIILEGGKTFGTVPLSLLSIIPGNQTLGNISNTFPLMNFYEFITDTYVNFHVNHHFNGKVFNKIPLIKKLKLRSVGFVRGAWGEISDENNAINRSSTIGLTSFRAPSDQIYYEYGFGIENIGISNIRPLRIDFNWRGNYLDNSTDIKKFGLTFGMDLSF